MLIGPGIAATNAHVAVRGLAVEGRDDHGKVYTFTRVLAIDMENDLAIIASDDTDTPYVRLLDARPNDPRDLRTHKIFAVGNTGGLGLSTYNGEIINVIQEGNRDVIMHNANTAGGSSGGPVWAPNQDRLLGVNFGSSPGLNASLAIPAWVVQGWLTRTKNVPGYAFNQAYDLSRADHIPLHTMLNKAYCLEPGQMAKIPVAMTNAVDFAYSVVPKSNVVLFAVVLYGEHVIDQVIVNDEVLRAFTTPVAGYYTLVLVNPTQNTSPGCAEIVAGEIDWGTLVNPR
ncbi:MAG: trypsin-like peptidase domain-containing protein [Bradymonadaceae bacterium]|nr:trypsin-like peptidase domain-containing protein [Lujinxingiaceae bacterium]